MKKFYDDKIIAGCAVSGIFNRKGKRISGENIINSIAVMHERSNGLGGGFAAYGIYPEFVEFYAFHLLFESNGGKEQTEAYLKESYNIEKEEEIPTANIPSIKYRPHLWRYFLKPNKGAFKREYGETEEDFVVKTVMHINADIEGAFVASSGKNMGVFKGVGFPEDIGRFYKLEEYKAHLWTSHGRFPTNTVGWWGGAHPFGILDWTVVHNGEVSSYGINKRYLENFGYYCTCHTDTEVITYLFDLLVRKHKLSFETASLAFCAPFWDEIDRMEKDRAELCSAIRMVYAGALINGPFSVLVGHSKGMVALNDRIKLRPLVAAEKGDTIYTASEECAIREIAPDLDKVWQIEGGKPLVVELEE